MKKLLYLSALVLLFTGQSFAQIARVTDQNLSIRAVTQAPLESIKIAYNPTDGFLYLITRNGDLHQINRETGARSVVQGSSHHGMSDVQGLAIRADGTFFLVGNSTNEQSATNTAYVKRARFSDNQWQWENVMETAPYPLSNTDFDHMMNEIVISPDGQHLYINSGSRTDHGEVQSANGRYPGLREAPLTGKIIRIPSDATDLFLQNDHDFLWDNGYIFVDGIRNSFGLGFNANGELFATDNAGERDDPEELNWLREGYHYGFPWYAGGNVNPMQFDGYDPSEDKLITTDARSQIFYNDPNFPPPPDTLQFMAPLVNHGPDGVKFRDAETGLIRDAFAEGKTLTTFTGHRSLLGLTFDADSILAAPFTGNAFVLSFTGGNDNVFLLQHMEDDGEDLMLLQFNKTDEETYEISSKIIADRFLNPIDSELVGNKLYVVEFRTTWLNRFANTRIWEITIPLKETDSSVDPEELPLEITLSQNYPNPFNPSTVISYTLPEAATVVLEVFDHLGRTVETLVNQYQQSGPHQVTFNATNLSSGVYFYRLHVPGTNLATQTRKMVLVK